MTPCIKLENRNRFDHSPVVLYCKIDNLKKDRGFWKFNISLLTDKDYVNKHAVKKTIGDVNIQYICQFCRKLIRLIDIANDTIHFTVKI